MYCTQQSMNLQCTVEFVCRPTVRSKVCMYSVTVENVCTMHNKLCYYVQGMFVVYAVECVVALNKPMYYHPPPLLHCIPTRSQCHVYD